MGPYLQGKEYEAAFKTDGNFSNLITKDNYEYVKEKSRHVSSAAKRNAIAIAIAKIEEAFKSTYVLPSCFQLIENYDCYVTCPAYANCSSREVKKDKMANVAEDIEKFCELFHNKVPCTINYYISFCSKRFLIVATFRDLAIYERENICS